MATFFAAAAVWGRLFLRDIPDAESWNPERVAYWDETYLDGVSRLALAGEKIRTAAELNAVIAASRRPPGLRPLWIHEELLGEALLRWQGAPAPATTWRWRVPAAFAAAVAAAFLAGHALGVPEPPRQSPPLQNQSGARGETAAPARFVAAASTGSPMVRPDAGRTGAAPARVADAAQAAQPVRPRAIARYAVDIGTFASSDAADRMRHLVLRKGYVVVVLRRGGLSSVVTPPYATRAQAEDIVRGLKASGIPHATVTGMVQ